MEDIWIHFFFFIGGVLAGMILNTSPRNKRESSLIKVGINQGLALAVSTAKEEGFPHVATVIESKRNQFLYRR